MMLPLTETPDPTLVTPGWIGFAVTAGIAIATILLLWDLNRRIRDIKYRAEAQEAIRLEQEAAAANEASDEDAAASGGADGADATAAPPDQDR